jgi:membrane protein implicated in regulation of membrane protease activity
LRRRRRPLLEPVELPLPKRPYRDSVIFHGVLAGLVVVVAFLTAGSLTRALLFAAGYFVIATAWSWWRFRQRIDEERQQQ